MPPPISNVNLKVAPKTIHLRNQTGQIRIRNVTDKESSCWVKAGGAKNETNSYRRVLDTTSIPEMKTNQETSGKHQHKLSLWGKFRIVDTVPTYYWSTYSSTCKYMYIHVRKTFPKSLYSTIFAVHILSTLSCNKLHTFQFAKQ